jgi:hypothetical protein
MVGAVVMAAGIAIALRHPSDAHPVTEEAAATSVTASAPSVPPVVVPPPAAPAPPVAVESRPAPAPGSGSSPHAVAAHRKVAHGDHKPAVEPKPAVPARGEPTDAVKRGKIPPHSGEAYPD